MATPQKVTRDEADDAITRITERRKQIDDVNRDMLSDDPADVLVYLRRYSGASIPTWVRTADVHDGLILTTYLWWRRAEDELWLLEAAERLSLARKEVGAPLRVTTGQGLVDRIHRLRAVLGPIGIPSEKLWREHQKSGYAPPPSMPAPAEDPQATTAAAAATARRHADADPRQPWLDRHRHLIDRIAETLVRHRHLADHDDDLASSLMDVSRNLKADEFAPAYFVELLFAVHDMEDLDTVQALAPSHELRQALDQFTPLLDGWKSLRQ